MVIDISLLYTQKYKVRIEDKVEQSRERSSALPYTSYWKGSNVSVFGLFKYVTVLPSEEVAILPVVVVVVEGDQRAPFSIATHFPG